jgi:hypothetical protein
MDFAARGARDGGTAVAALGFARRRADALRRPGRFAPPASARGKSGLSAKELTMSPSPVVFRATAGISWAVGFSESQ